MTSPRLAVPWATIALVFACLAVAFLGVFDPGSTERLAYLPARPSLAAALTCLFVHANLVHLLGNMVFLAAVGPRVESAAGHWGLLAIFLGGGAAGVLAHQGIMASLGANTPLVGASGAIAGIAGYAAIRYMHRRVPLAPRVTVTVGAVTLAWVVLQAVGAFVAIGGFPVTAFWSHLAGFFFGLVASLVMRAPEQARLQFGYETLDRMGDRGPGAVLRAAEAHLAEHPDDPRALRELAEALHSMGETAHEAQIRARLVEAVPEAERAAALADLARAQGLRFLSPIRRMRLASELSDPILRRSLYESVLAEPEGESQRPFALLNLVEMGADEAGAHVRELREQFEFHPASDAARAKGLLR
ncbi:MAG: rhomboid family intramembrane serine protease [Fimbriimonadaceae bacterium]|nr:rhomboid family intramembrane serine protease [Fimbriimonadaceae bacterium]QYK56192.1 MAG: rhomboid family intramembrane serine protease [Fimbriimonadaceae bacterium]